jgi:DNA modification methylase/rubredoxin
MHQDDLFPLESSTPQVSREERRAWREKLRRHLADPQFRRIPGFPIASDDAILALSDPPYYTACPNPFMEEILAQWRAERTELRQQLGLPDDSENTYHREPFAADVSEGKNDPIYNAHSYHTKVPHKAIMRYILHYTDPGDIVLDGFCGTGMTGVAAQLCGDQKTVESLGYRVDKEGIISEDGKPVSRLGARKAVLVDLSPAATFIAYNYNTPVDARAFEREARLILAEVEKECGWMYETRHTDGSKGRINYTVWSDVFVCPQCGQEMVFWDVAVDHQRGQVREDWPCPGCNALLSKSPRKKSRALRVERVFETKYDRAIGQTVRQARQVPVLINYSVGKKRYEKRPDEDDLALVEKIENSEIPYPFPTQPLPTGDKTGDPHVHHFYTRRNLWALAAIFSKTRQASKHTILFLIFAFQQLVMGMSKWGRYVPSHYSQVNQGLSGTLYIASQVVEVSPEYIMINKISRLAILWSMTPYSGTESIITSQSANLIEISDASADYIFVDPPFGANLMYSELNFLWEAWLGVFTNNQPEAVINRTQRKGLPEYQALMEACFREFYRVLKPGRWMTVEFHNSQNAVWNAIQEALLRAGFVVADVRTFDKQQGTFNQVTASGAVKRDLIISAYKPPAAFEQRFALEAGTVDGAWEFVRQHLEFLPMPALKDEVLLEFVQERTPYVLFDRMVAYHVQRGLAVPLSAAEFYSGLKEHFAEREGMIFTYPQASQFDRLRLEAEQVEQMSLIITDEKSAIQWLRIQLMEGAKTYSELLIRFNQESRKLPYEQMPELREMLEENFLQDEEGRWRLPDPSKESDLQALREKSLLREFAMYLQSKGKLKAFRLEAIRAGFSRAWKERNYGDIVKVANRLPERVFEDDPQLLMYADNARLRFETQPRQENLL